MKFFKYLLISLLAYSFISLFVPPVHAQGEWVFDYPEGRKETETNDSMNKSSYVFSSQADNMAGMVEFTLGAVEGVTVPVGTYKNDPQYAQKINQRAALTGISNMIVAIYANPPANLALWIRDTGQTLGFIPPQAHAQAGIGFAGLAPLLPIWKAFRNIAYFLLAVVMVVIGFMVMLRKKIDPKTVVTVQNALPKIVIALLLITFSYAIVGIMVDAMYLTILLAVAVFESTGLLPDPSGLTKLYGTNESIFSTGGLNAVFSALFPWGGVSIADLALDITGWNLITSLIAGGAGALIGLIIGGPAAFAGAAIGALGAPVLVAFLLALALLFTFIQLFIMFLKAYIQIILALITAPVQLMLEAVPGSNSFASWFKNLFANLAVFPIAAVMFMLTLIFATAADQYTGKVWSPPFLSLSPSARSVAALFAIGVLFTIPQVVGSIKEALKAKAPVPVGPGAIFAPFTSAFQVTMGTASQFYYGSAMIGAIAKWLSKKKE